MANRAVKRDASTLQNELFMCVGQIIISGTTTGVTQTGVTVNGLSGSLPTVLSGSSPNQFSSQYAVVRNVSGSYSIQMADVWPKLLCATFTLGSSGSQGLNAGAMAVPAHAGFKVIQDTSGPTRWDSPLLGGVNKVDFTLLSGSQNDSAGYIAKDPLGKPLVVDVALWFANSTV